MLPTSVDLLKYCQSKVRSAHQLSCCLVTLMKLHVTFQYPDDDVLGCMSQMMIMSSATCVLHVCYFIKLDTWGGDKALDLFVGQLSIKVKQYAKASKPSSSSFESGPLGQASLSEIPCFETMKPSCPFRIPYVWISLLCQILSRLPRP